MNQQVTITNLAATPDAEIAIDVALVRGLLEGQHPDLADLVIQHFASGWDNEMFRLGDEFVVRLPRRAVAVPLLLNEQRWLPLLAKQLPLPIPLPIRIGKPSQGYPWPWSVLPRLLGVAADQAQLRSDQGIVLAKFLRTLHVNAPPDAPKNSYRGVNLSQRASAVEERLTRLAQSTQLISDAIRCCWQEALAAPIDVADTWLHGDLHAQNVLVHEGKLSAIIDWGDVCKGDCATDLASFWMLLPDAKSRAIAIKTYGASEATLQRARGWAILFGSILLESGRVNNPRHAAMGERTLVNITEDYW